LRTRTIALVGALVAASVACRQDMHDQPTYSALEASDIFEDGSASRPPIPGTVARGQLKEDVEFYTGKLPGEAGDPVTEFPFPIDERVMARGREMFDAYCAVCHGRTGAGDGMVVRRGFSRPPSLVDDRMRDLPPGHFFDIISNGFGAMPDHASQIRVEDRWAIVAYLRALQLSASVSVNDIPPAERARLEQLAR
jgi:mono/diheme cytochrome c family protein